MPSEPLGGLFAGRICTPTPSWTMACRAPPITVLLLGTACITNAVGAKGVGESGTTVASCALVNAVVDALHREPGLTIDMPLTPEKVWRALHTR